MKRKFSDTTIEKAQQIFSRRAGREYSEEESAEALNNLVSFFTLLLDCNSEKEKKDAAWR